MPRKILYTKRPPSLATLAHWHLFPKKENVTYYIKSTRKHCKGLHHMVMVPNYLLALNSTDLQFYCIDTLLNNLLPL